MEVRITKLRVALAGLFVLAGVGLASLLSPLVGTALATVGQVVNVSDPTAANTAKVDPAGKLYVGDGAGPLSVDGTVASRSAAPASPWSKVSSLSPTIGIVIAGPSAAPINVTSLSISTTAPSGSGISAHLEGHHVPGSATSCSGAILDGTIWFIQDIGDGVTPVSFTFPTPLQWKPPGNTKACLVAYGGSSVSGTTMMNAVGFYGG